MPKTTINERILAIIKKEKLNENSFAIIIGANRQTINKLSKVTVTNPSYQFLMSIIEAFPHINITWLMTGKGKYTNLL